MRGPRLFFDSPLARHPRLLARKIASRLHLRSDVHTCPSLPVAELFYPEEWQSTLRTWIRQIPFNPGPHSFSRVFGREFDELQLLQLCRTGPLQGRKDLLGDIKLVWDYSRAYPLFTNAALGPAQVDHGVAFLQRWLQANEDTTGPSWICAMDVAIRAVNWIFADVLWQGELSRRFGSVEFAQWLWRHGFLIWHNLEARLISSNHYLSNLLGLAVIGSVFPQDPQARRWLAFARQEFPQALLKQTRPDGGLNEASLRYHVFVTEMALLVRLSLNSPFGDEAENRLQAMCQIVADFRDATGDVFPIGDDDSGRVLAPDFASVMGRADVVLRLAACVLNLDFECRQEVVCRESGWWIWRRGEFSVMVEFGGVGMGGLGGHAHNDDLSFCLEWRGKTVITDPGTYLYTPDPKARNRFRSAFSHNGLIIDALEEPELNESIFSLAGSDQSASAAPMDGSAWSFSRTLRSGISHRRMFSHRGDEVSMCDKIEGSGKHELQWRFHLHPSVQPTLVSKGFLLKVPEGGTLILEASGGDLFLEVVTSEHSPAYGQIETATACVAKIRNTLPASVEWRIRPIK